MKSNKKNTKTTAAKKATKSATKKATTIFGFAPTAVARCLGKAKFETGQVIAAFKKFAPKVSLATIRTQVVAGRHGQRGTPAPLNKTQLGQLKAAAA
jgi:hypothetical protein